MTRSEHRSNLRRWMLGACAAAAITGLAACGGDDEKKPAAAADTPATTEQAAARTPAEIVAGKPLEGKTIAFISGAPIEYYTLSAKSATMAIEQLGGTAKVLNSNGDPQKELANVQTAITQGVDGLIMIPLSTAGEKAELQQLANAKIPAVMLYGHDKTLEEYGDGFVQVDFEEYGRIVGEQMKKVVPEGDVAIITGLPGRAEVPQGSAGLRAGFGDDDRIVAEVPGDWDRQKAFAQTKSLMTKYPDLKGLMVQNDDMAIGAITALGSKTDQVAVSSMNGSPEGFAAFKAGKIKVLAGNSVPIEAGQAVRYLVNAMAGNQNQPKLCFTQTQILDPDDAEAAKAWLPTPELIATGLEKPCANAE